MDMRSREQYLENVRQEYRQADRKQKTELLNEARKRTRLNRKVLIRKLAHPPKVRVEGQRRPRKATYGPEVVSTLVKVWELFDYPCGQRLVPAMRGELERLRKSKDVRCSDEIAEKLARISAKTVDRLLAREKQVRHLRRNRNPAPHRLLYQQIPVKVAAEWDTNEVGNLQVDYVEHCGRRSAVGLLSQCGHPHVALAAVPEERQRLGGTAELDARAQTGGISAAGHDSGVAVLARIV
jgi:hypothetical protein